MRGGGLPLLRREMEERATAAATPREGPAIVVSPSPEGRAKVRKRGGCVFEREREWTGVVMWVGFSFIYEDGSHRRLKPRTGGKKTFASLNRR